MESDKVRQAYDTLLGHYRECYQCRTKVHYKLGELCARGRELHDTWDAEFYNPENWTRKSDTNI